MKSASSAKNCAQATLSPLFQADSNPLTMSRKFCSSVLPIIVSSLSGLANTIRPNRTWQCSVLDKQSSGLVQNIADAKIAKIPKILQLSNLAIDCLAMERQSRNCLYLLCGFHLFKNSNKSCGLSARARSHSPAFWLYNNAPLESSTATAGTPRFSATSYWAARSRF